MKKYLEKDQLLYLLMKIKEKIPTKTSDITNDSGFITSADVSGGLKITGDDTNNPGTDVSFLAPKDSSGNLLLQAGAGLSIQNLANDAGVRFNVECGEWIDGSYAPASVSDAKNAVDTLATTISNTYAKKDDITKMMTYKGSVATFDALPTNASVGDTYNVESDGMNYTWTGTAWDAAGSTFTINEITNEEIDTMFTNW